MRRWPHRPPAARSSTSCRTRHARRRRTRPRTTRGCARSRARTTRTTCSRSATTSPRRGPRPEPRKFRVAEHSARAYGRSRDCTGRRRRPARGDPQDLHRRVDRPGEQGVHLPHRPRVGAASSTTPSRSSRACPTRPSRASPAWRTTGCSDASSRERSCSTSAAAPGTDLLIAAQMTGPDGRVIGVDMTPAMLERAGASAREMGLGNVELHEVADRVAPARGRLGRRRDLQRRDRPRARQGGGVRRDRPRPASGRPTADGRRGDPPRGVRGRAHAHRPLDRLNRRRAAPG